MILKSTGTELIGNMNIIKRLDKYLLLQFFKVVAGSLVFMIGLFLITLYLDNIKIFSHPNVPFILIIKYILNIIPEIFIQVLPPAALFSTSYIFGNMNSNNEIIAIYNGRIGFTRLIFPLMISGLIMAIGLFLFFEFVSAESSNRAAELKQNIKKLSGKTLGYMYSNSKLFLKGADDTIYYVEFFDSENGIMQSPVIFKFDVNGDILFQLNAVSGTFNEIKKIWIFKNVYIMRKIGDGKYNNEKRNVYSMSLQETPGSFMKTSATLMQMKLKNAIDFINTKRKTGADYKKYLVEFHWRFAFPFSVVITILIGSITGIYFRKAVLVISFFVAIIVSFGYYGIMATGMALGKSGKLDPVIAAWIANVIYLAGGTAALKLKK
jgi:lipopolysaccharide export system permease protein